MIAVHFAVSVVCERFCERQMHSADDVYNEKKTWLSGLCVWGPQQNVHHRKLRPRQTGQLILNGWPAKTFQLLGNIGKVYLQNQRVGSLFKMWNCIFRPHIAQTYERRSSVYFQNILIFSEEIIKSDNVTKFRKIFEISCRFWITCLWSFPLFPPPPPPQRIIPPPPQSKLSLLLPVYSLNTSFTSQ